MRTRSLLTLATVRMAGGGGAADRYDTQKLSTAGTTSRNAHNDACFLKGYRSEKADGPASFDASGVGSISACPDPDAAGPKVAILRDRNGDAALTSASRAARIAIDWQNQQRSSPRVAARRACRPRRGCTRRGGAADLELVFQQPA